MNKLKSLRYFIESFNLILNRRQKRLGVVVLIASIIGAFLQMLGVSIIVPLVSAMMQPDEFMELSYIKKLCDAFDLSTSVQVFRFLCIAVIVLYIFKNLYCVFQTWLSAKYSQKIQRELSMKIFHSYMSRQYDYFIKRDSSRIFRDIANEPECLNSMLICIFNFLAEVLTVAFIIVYIIISDWMMAVCISILALICLAIIYGFFKNKVKHSGEIQRFFAIKKNSIVFQSIYGIKEVQVMKKQKYFEDKYLEYLRKTQKSTMDIQVASVTPTFMIEGVFVTGIMAYICVSVGMDSDFTKKIPMLASFMLAAVRMLPSLGRISSSINSIIFNMPALISVRDNIETLNFNYSNYMESIVDDGKVIGFDDSLKLENVSWHYDDSDKYILNNINMQVKKGESIGIVGASGAGKSTLADIILGIHVPQKGEVKIDDVNVNNMPYAYSRIIGYVPQNTYLFDGTIKENIAFGVDENDIDDKQVIEALKKAQMYEFVQNELENGINTVIGEQGIKLSGGQRQRISIARALYRKPEILILDEATSALDNDTEEAVMQAIEGLYGEITLIVIAHRLTTVLKCDRIIEVGGGKLFEKDKDELVERIEKSGKNK